MTPEQITAKKLARNEALKADLLTAFETAMKTALSPITYSGDIATDEAHTKRAEKIYGNLIGLALSDLQISGFITDHVLGHLESAINEFPAEAIPKLMEETSNTLDVTRKCLQISHTQFTNAVTPLMGKIKALSPSSAQDHHQQGMKFQR